jgi:chemotaxis protein methyltransferase CheR
MMTSANTVTVDEFASLRDYIEDKCGIALDENKGYLIETRLAKLMVESGCENFTEFARLAKSESGTVLRDKIIDAMTTNETLWFRDGHPYTIMSEKILPDLADQLKSGNRATVRIWSAACSTGQEPYSIAMEIHEFCKTCPGVRPEQFEIIGTDISSAALFLAHAGRYDQLAIKRGLDDEVRQRYFEQDGRVWKLTDEIKRMVTFKKYNLQDSLTPLGNIDVVFLRYVAIYFAEKFKQTLMANIANLLRPSGYLVIGAVESLLGVSREYDLLTHAGGNYYKVQP